MFGVDSNGKQKNMQSRRQKKLKDVNNKMEQLKVFRQIATNIILNFVNDFISDMYQMDQGDDAR